MGGVAQALRRGYSLTEMMVVVVIIAVVSAYALPAIDGFLSSQKVEADARLFAENIRLGRYKALQEQVLHRIAFDPVGSDGIMGYKVEAYKPYDADYLDLDLADDAATLLKVPVLYSGDLNWASVLDQDEVVFDGSVEVTAGSGVSSANYIIYFYPTGYLVKAPMSGSGASAVHVIRNESVTNIEEIVFTFTYGNAQAKVYVNALGVLSSESYALGADDD